jgi:hypothetical protein
MPSARAAWNAASAPSKLPDWNALLPILKLRVAVAL